MPAWQPPVGAQIFPAAQAGREEALPSPPSCCAITAFVLLGFCIIAGATGVEESLIGGAFILSVLLALAGAVMGIIATSRSSKDTSTSNAKAVSIVALVLNGLYMLITVVFLIVGAVASKSN